MVYVFNSLPMSVVPLNPDYGRLCQYLPRSGIATPSQIVNAVQEGSYEIILVPTPVEC